MSKKVRELRKLLSVVLALVLIATAPSVSALADEAVTSVKSGTCGIGLTWVLYSNGTLTISGSGAMEDYHVKSPSPWNKESRSVIKSIVIEQGVTSIGDYAFSFCRGLTGITIPESVTSIGEWAFSGCSGLTSITIPESVTSIGKGAFLGCSGLTSIIIPESVTSIESNAFRDCSGLTSITIPDSVTSIGLMAFLGCSGMTGITIPDSVTAIEYKAFSNCSSLMEVTIPKSVTGIDVGAYAGCSDLSTIHFEGDAPKFIERTEHGQTISGNVFDGVTATAYYPAGNATYTDAVKKGYGGNITWVEGESQNGIVIEADGTIKYYENNVESTTYTGMATHSSTGRKYWFDSGVAARDKQVYDPDTKAWYWFDADGTMAVSKDVFVPESNENRENGKWVRYDENGGMVKGEDYRYDGWYRFDEITGEMIKGWYTTEDGKTYYYNDVTGQMEHGAVTVEGKPCAFDNVTGVAINCAWYEIGGNEYWYENGVRQGLEGRGKEIYDFASNAWYWLDSIDGGKKAVSKDVYQESYAGAFADRPDGTGKWVRYDADGHMIKGWSEMNGNTYYFDYQTGAMAKGWANIDGVDYYFNEVTGILR